MARKGILTKNQIIDTAFGLVKERGIECLNARSLAKACHTSTQPIFTLFPSISEIAKEVKDRSYALYDSLIQHALQEKIKPFQAVGNAYLHFAISYPNLFRLIFMSESDQSYCHFTIDHNAEKILMDVMEEYHLSKKYSQRLYFESWVYTHGLATMIVTKTMKLSNGELSRMMHDVVYGTYLGLKEEMEKKHE